MIEFPLASTTSNVNTRLPDSMLLSIDSGIEYTGPLSGSFRLSLSIVIVSGSSEYSVPSDIVIVTSGLKLRYSFNSNLMSYSP